MTNYERIINMGVEKMADYIYTHDDELNDVICKTAYMECPFGDSVESNNCKDCIKKWLRSEVNKE